MASRLALVCLCLLFVPASQAIGSYVWNTETVVNASTTDSRIVDSDPSGPGFGPHTIFVNTSAPVYSKLFVFLPATSTQSQSYRYILNSAAAIGWKAIGLAYNNTNDPTYASLCGSAGLGVQDCQINTRLQNLLSGSYSSLLPVDQNNCIANRLYRLLLWLHSTQPTQGWDSFYNAGSSSNISQLLRWDLMAWGGHSQGGGTVQIVGMYFPTTRVLQIAPSGVITTHSATIYTPLSATYMFVDLSDTTYVEIQGMLAFGPFTQLTTLGAAVTIDGLSPTQYGGSHVLLTNSSAPLCQSIGAHACPAFDPNQVLDSQGSPVFTVVWQYMLGPAPPIPSPSPAPTTTSTTSSSTSAPATTTSTGATTGAQPTSTAALTLTTTAASSTSAADPRRCSLLAFLCSVAFVLLSM